MLVGEEDLAVKARIVQHAPVSEFDIMLDRLEGAGADGADAFFFAFAPNVDDLAEEVHILEVQSDQFADPHAGAVEDFEDSAVACAEPGIGGRGVQQSLDLFIFEEFRQLFVLLGCFEGADGVAADDVSLDEEFVEASQGRQFSGGGGLGIVSLAEKGHELSHGLDIGLAKQLVDVDLCLGLCGRLRAARGGLPVGGTGRFRLGPVIGFQEVRKLFEISAVTLGGVIGEMLFKF